MRGRPTGGTVTVTTVVPALTWSQIPKFKTKQTHERPRYAFVIKKKDTLYKSRAFEPTLGVNHHLAQYNTYANKIQGRAQFRFHLIDITKVTSREARE